MNVRNSNRMKRERCDATQSSFGTGVRLQANTGATTVHIDLHVYIYIRTRRCSMKAVELG